MNSAKKLTWMDVFLSLFFAMLSYALIFMAIIIISEVFGEVSHNVIIAILTLFPIWVIWTASRVVRLVRKLQEQSEND